jgi:8-oxo-dGTP diphosphatase
VTRRGEKAFLSRYDPSAFPPFALTVDLSVFTIRDGLLCLLLVARGGHPYRGWWALPGGHVAHGVEDADGAARRELEEETGFDWTDRGHLEQVRTYSDPRRDPRIAAGLHVASVSYAAIAPDLPDPVAGTDASGARFWPLDDLDLVAQRDAWLAELPYEGDAPALAFDHAVIALDARERVRAKLEYTTLAAQFVAEPFSLADLRRVYAAVWGEAPDLANFRRKVLSSPGFVKQAEDRAASGGRPAQLYHRGHGERIDPPFMP